jgi:hypothetical protein
VRRAADVSVAIDAASCTDENASVPWMLSAVEKRCRPSIETTLLK